MISDTLSMNVIYVCILATFVLTMDIPTLPNRFPSGKAPGVDEKVPQEVS